MMYDMFEYSPPNIPLFGIFPNFSTAPTFIPVMAVDGSMVTMKSLCGVQSLVMTISQLTSGTWTTAAAKVFIVFAVITHSPTQRRFRHILYNTYLSDSFLSTGNFQELFQKVNCKLWHCTGTGTTDIGRKGNFIEK